MHVSYPIEIYDHLEVRALEYKDRILISLRATQKKKRVTESEQQSERQVVFVGYMEPPFDLM